jgi:hypothetical protein
MKAVKGWIKGLSEISVSNRQAMALAAVTGMAFAALIVAWLAMSTRTALLNQQLDDLDAQQTQLLEEINRTWTEIGEETAPRAMEDRARQLGFKPVEEMEYLVTTPEVTTTAPITLTNIVTQ